MTFRRQSGTAYVTVDGTTIPAKGSFTIPLSTKNRTDIVVGDEASATTSRPSPRTCNARCRSRTKPTSSESVTPRQ